MINILILCTGNSCRSQMADGWLRKFLNNKANVFSAGTNPEPVNPYAVKVMSSVGVDISKNTSNHVDDYIGLEFDYVITVCDNAKEICPIFPKAKKVIHNSFKDPAAFRGEDLETLEFYALIRDELKSFLINFCELDLGVKVFDAS